jgi:molybdopterin converting factor small subunit
MITIQVQFFGGQHLFTRRLTPEIERALPKVTLPDGATADDLLQLLNISTRNGRPFVSVNRFVQRENVTLADGDRVQLIATVIGGSSRDIDGGGIHAKIRLCASTLCGGGHSASG